MCLCLTLLGLSLRSVFSSMGEDFCNSYNKTQHTIHTHTHTAQQTVSLTQPATEAFNRPDIIRSLLSPLLPPLSDLG